MDHISLLIGLISSEGCYVKVATWVGSAVPGKIQLMMSS